MDYFKQLKIDRSTLDSTKYDENEYFNYVKGPKEDNGIINKIGISAKPGTKTKINDIVFEIGKTGLLEIEGWTISNLAVQRNKDSILNEHILIDYRTNSPDTVLSELKESE